MIASFSTLDTVIVVVYLAISVGIGLVANRFITGMAGYLVAGRSLGTALSIATMTGSELGLITVMYQAQKGYNDGFKALHIGLIAGVVTLIVGLSGFLVVRLRRTGVMTIPEYYEQRFGRRVRVLGGALLALGGILNMGLFLKIGGEFVVAVMGLDPQGAGLPMVMTALLVMVLIYTVLGGMVSVVLTDYIQFVVLSIGLVFMVVLVLSHFGMDQIVELWQARTDEGAMAPPGGIGPRLPVGTGPITVEAFDPVEGHGLNYISWQAVVGFVSCAIWPTAVTRALSARDERVVKSQYALSSISFMIRFLIPCFMGIAAYAYLTGAGAVLWADGSFLVQDDMAGYNSRQAFPVMLREILPIGVLGLITAAMLAAFMSTHDSYLLCWASVISRDVLSPLRHEPPSDRQQLRWTRIWIVVVGLWVLAWGILFEPTQDIWDYLSVTGAIYFTGAIAVLIAGLYWRRASTVGAACALIAGFSALLGLGPVQAMVGLDGWKSWNIGLMTLGLAGAAMIVGSLLFPDRDAGTSVAEEVR